VELDSLIIAVEGVGFDSEAVATLGFSFDVFEFEEVEVDVVSTSIDFTGIPAWARRIVVSLIGVSTNGTTSVGVQLGDSGGIETSGYSCGVFDDSATGNFTAGIFDNSGSAAIVRHGQFHLTLSDPATNTWSCIFILGYSNAASGRAGGGSKSLSAALDRIRLTTSGGADTFDAGSVNIAYW
jgi:hypothetical protein